MNNQIAQISVPPIMKQANGWSTDGSAQTVLPAVDNKSYMIHAVIVNGSNTAGTAATIVAINYTDFWEQKYRSLVGINLNPNVVNSNLLPMTGLNIPTAPGKPVELKCDVAAATMGCTVWYSEVN